MSAPTVFVSAATLDLEECRNDLRGALERAGCKVYIQRHDDEGFSASAGDVLLRLRQHLDKSDFVLHVAGRAYGGEPTQPAFPEWTEFRCSYTQFEYYYAHALGKKVFGFLCGDGFPIRSFEESGTDRTDQELRRQLQASHCERIGSGKFQDTPWKDRGFRAINETLSTSKSLLTATAAVIGTIRDTEKDIEARALLSRAISELDKLAEQRHEEVLDEISNVPKQVADELTKRGARIAVIVMAICIFIAGLFWKSSFWQNETTSRPSVLFDSLSASDHERLKGASVGDVVVLARECESKQIVSLANRLENRDEDLLRVVDFFVKNNISPDEFANGLSASEKRQLSSCVVDDVENISVQSSNSVLRTMGRSFSDSPELLLLIVQELVK